MAAGKWNMQKASGGVASITVADGPTNTDLVLPESGTVATTSNIVGFKNYIINGGFNINQYPSFSNTSDGYKFDRWFVTGASAFSSMAIGSLNNEAASDKGLNFIKNGTADGFISQRIEFPRRLAGKTVTVSFSTYSAVSMNASVYFDGYNPTDGTTINLGNMRQNFTWGTGWVRRKFTLTLPSLNSNYNNANSYIMLAIHIVNGSTTTGAWLTDVQLEEGSIATPFEQRPYGLELSLCQRYYEVGRCIQQLGIGTTIGVMLTGQAFFKTSKRIVPTVTCLDFSGAQNKVTLLNNSGAETNGVSITAGNQTHNDMRLTASTTNTTQNGISFTYTASAEL